MKRFNWHGMVKCACQKMERVLRLEPEPQQFVFIPIPGRAASRMEKTAVTDEEYKKWYDDQPWRGVALARVQLFLYRIGSSDYGTRRAIRNCVNWWKRRRAWKAFWDAREFSYRSWYVHPRDESEFEGYLQFSRHRMALTIVTPMQLSRMVNAEREMGYPMTGHYPGWRGEVVWVPGPTLSNADVESTLNSWYQDKVGWRRGHWTRREDKMPVFHVDLEWEKKGTTDGRERA